VSKRGAAGDKAADKCNPLRGFTCPIQQAFHYPDRRGAAPVLTLVLQSGLSSHLAEARLEVGVVVFAGVLGTAEALKACRGT
jgi:hypothetical protein